MPDWLMIAVPAGLFIAVVAAFAWGLCDAASRADDALEAERERAMADVARLPEPQIAEVLHLDRARRTRRDARNGLGGAA